MKTPKNDANKRRHSRLSRTFSVEVDELTFPVRREKTVETKCYDISEGGLSIDSPRPFITGEKIQVKINIPLLNKFSPGFFKVYENDADQYFLAIAEIMWCKMKAGRYLVGMRYINVDESQASALSGFINKAFRAPQTAPRSRA
jgi:c-di-GMP-binding flagellar brake protein YcgR